MSNVSESDEKDLGDILPDELFNHPDCFDSTWYDRWERDIAQPALEAKGYQVLRWWSGDEDSFGPLVRCVRVKRDNLIEVYTYG